MFDIKYAAGVRKDLSKIDKKHLEKIKNAAESLTDFPDISNIKRLSAHPLADYRLRDQVITEYCLMCAGMKKLFLF